MQKLTGTATAAQKPTAKKNPVKSANTNTTGRSSNTTADTKKQSLLEKMFVDMLKDIYWAEDHLIEALQTMKDAATTDELQDAFEDHRLQTQKHKSRLEKVFQLIGEEAETKKCEAMAGLTKEAESIIEETQEGTMTRDAALIIAAQKVEHYEIASYGSLVQVARTLGHDRAADLLEKTLWEEEDTDQLLTQIAETDINPMADEESEDATEEE